jgi:hypothetical protein
MAADGVGGVFVAFTHRLNPGKARMQHLDANGVRQWGDSGIAISSMPNTALPVLIADGQGGVFASWLAESRLYVQRFNSGGFPQWVSTEGSIACQSIAPQQQRMVSDGNGGFVMAWDDYRGVTGDIYAQGVDAAGANKWTTNGVPLCTAFYDQTLVGLVSDGAGGAIAAWNDRRNGPYRLFARRISGSGLAMWDLDGVEACTVPGSQDFVSMAITSDGAGGGILTWVDSRAGGSDLYAQRLSPTGARLWGDAGLPLCTASGFEYQQIMIPDGANGAVVVWADSRSGVYELYAQRIGPNGGRLWAASGVRISSSSGNLDRIGLVQTGVGLVAAFTDERGSTIDVSAQLFSLDGTLGAIVTGVGPDAGPGERVRLAVAPLPANAEVAFSFHAGSAGRASLTVFDLQGRALRRLENPADEAGIHRLRWDLRDEDGRRVRSGVYLARLDLNGEILRARVVVVD